MAPFDDIYHFINNSKLWFIRVETDTKGNTTTHHKTPSKDEEHLSEITHVSSCGNLSIFASSSRDGALKIWNSDGLLIREMMFDTTLSGLCFSNQRGDILVSLIYGRRIHFFRICTDSFEIALFLVSPSTVLSR